MSVNDTAPLYGLVMIGGQSQRMQQDKAWLNYRGKPQVQISTELLSQVCEQVFISMRPDQNAEQIRELLPECAVIPDRLLGFGPLGGLLSAQIAHPSAAWFVLACDLPCMDLETLQLLAGQRQPQLAVTSFISPFDGKSEPLCAIYEPQSHSALLPRLQASHHCLRKVIKNLPHQLIEAPNPQALANANTQQDYQQLQELISDPTLSQQESSTYA